MKQVSQEKLREMEGKGERVLNEPSRSQEKEFKESVPKPAAPPPLHHVSYEIPPLKYSIMLCKDTTFLLNSKAHA